MNHETCHGPVWNVWPALTVVTWTDWFVSVRRPFFIKTLCFLCHFQPGRWLMSKRGLIGSASVLHRLYFLTTYIKSVSVCNRQSGLSGVCVSKADFNAAKPLFSVVTVAAFVKLHVVQYNHSWAILAFVPVLVTFDLDQGHGISVWSQMGRWQFQYFTEVLVLYVSDQVDWIWYAYNIHQKYLWPVTTKWVALSLTYSQDR